MANSKFEYVRDFEREEFLLPNTWIVVRIDGRGFHKIATHYSFTRPSDIRALNLMNSAAQHTLTTLPDLMLAYGHSDEYSFVFSRDTTLFDRRAAKLVTTVVSTFTAAYIALWPRYMIEDGKTSTETDGHNEDTARSTTPAAIPLDLAWLPTFDGRAVCYPSERNLRDYLSWRQVDCHINNLYNTTFWALVLKGGMTNSAAETFLKGTVSSDKNEILFSRFGMNYNNEPAISRRGTVVYRDFSGSGKETPQDERSSGNCSELQSRTRISKSDSTNNGDSEIKARNSKANGKDKSTAATESEISSKEPSKTQLEKMKKARRKAGIVVEHVDIVKDGFWNERRWLLS